MVHIFSLPAASRDRPLALAVTLALILTLAGCASAPPPNDSMNQAQNLLQTARDAGAADYAPVDLGFAQDKFQQAQSAMSDRKYANATGLAEESRADAELATAKARLGAARAKIQQRVQENSQLRSEGEQAQAEAEQKLQQEQAQDQQMQQQQQQAGAPANASSSAPSPSSIPTPPLQDMPAPSSSALSAPPSSSGGFQSVPASNQPSGSSQPDSGQHLDNNDGGQP